MYFHARGKSRLALGYSSYFVEGICSQEGCWSVVFLSRDAWLWYQVVWPRGVSSAVPSLPLLCCSWTRTCISTGWAQLPSPSSWWDFLHDTLPSVKSEGCILWPPVSLLHLKSSGVRCSG